jgi:NAD(P)-dependent dehydrogenase (short-subunit alcohol dehydrogenase family)
MLEGKNAVVVGASRGLGRGVAESLSAAGASVLAIARDRTGLEELSAADSSIDIKVADATDPTVAGDVIYTRDPDILAVVAGATRRCCTRFTTTRGRRSRSRGTSMCASRSTGCARRC